MTTTNELIPILQNLVRIPSPNPPGDTRAVAEYVAERLRQAGCQVRLLAPPAKPEALSVVAVIGQGDPVVMLHAHIDTVPIGVDEAGKWHVDPYAAVIENGRVYGKGSVDDKGPMAAMMQTMLHAAAHSDQLKGTLVLVGAAEEEVGGKLGTRWLAESGHLPQCDFIVVGEQTFNRVAIAHKGVMRATVRTTGRSVHATNPDRGVNAITAMAKAITALQAYHERLRERTHLMVGSATCNVGVIQGGNAVNVVPDTCVVELDRRMVPPEDPADVRREMEAVIAALDVSPAVISIGDWYISEWFDSTADSPLAQTFLDCARTILQADPGPVGYLPGSDAKHLMGVMRGEMVVFGPGTYEVAHAFDEYVEIAELEATTHILIQFINQTLLNGAAL